LTLDNYYLWYSKVMKSIFRVATLIFFLIINILLAILVWSEIYSYLPVTDTTGSLPMFIRINKLTHTVCTGTITTNRTIKYFCDKNN